MIEMSGLNGDLEVGLKARSWLTRTDIASYTAPKRESSTKEPSAACYPLFSLLGIAIGHV